jgi:tetratricopeptide (TPR) repeat protein
LLLSVVPGWGHAYWGWEFHGLVLFTAAAVSAFAMLNGVVIYQGSWRTVIVVSSATVLALSLAAAWIDILKRTSPGRVRREEDEKEKLLLDGTAAYLRGEFAQAVLSFRRCVRLEPQDPAAHFRVGVALSRSGDGRQARRWLRRALRCDVDSTWHWEVRRELARAGGTSRRVTEVPTGTREEEAEPASA